MKNKDIFQRDPTAWQIANNGVSSNSEVEPDSDTLAYEITHFVCDGEYRNGFEKILTSFLKNLGKEQPGAWVSGFYGSGKSHLVKVLRYFWTDAEIGKHGKARSLANLPPEIKEALKELSNRAKSHGGLHSAGGTLKAGAGSVRHRVLGILFQSLGLPEKVGAARFILDLQKDKKYEKFCKFLKSNGHKLEDEIDSIHVSEPVREAYLECYPNYKNTEKVMEVLRAAYPRGTPDISMPEMLDLFQRALSKNGEIPCTVVVLDEVQQFINEDPSMALDVQEVAEKIQKNLQGRVLLVATGQNALNDTTALQKIMARFPIKIHLKDNDVEKVVRSVVLAKKPEKIKSIEEMCAKHSGEIERQLSNTKICTRSEDAGFYAMDYPLLPVRRRFWEYVLHHTDPSGTTAQMRTQLQVTHDACRHVANKELGNIVPADFLYEQIAGNLVQTGELQKRFQEIIEEQKKKPEGDLRKRICALVFLINKLPRENSEVDIGVRANAEHLSDLLTEDLISSTAKLRKEIPALLEKMVTENILMLVSGEYRLQTTEGASWESLYKKNLASLVNAEERIAPTRTKHITDAVRAELDKVNVLHGKAKEKRKATIHFGPENPKGDEGITIWVRDGFVEDERSVIDEIRRKSQDDPLIYLLIPRSKTDDLKKAIAGILAADETLNSKGHPTSQEGRDAKEHIESRKRQEEFNLRTIIRDIFQGNRLYLAGGQEENIITLKEAAEEACDQVLGRLYPKFDIADSANWPTALNKAKAGNADALSALSYAGDPDKHPVSIELLREIGSGKKGSELIGKFCAPPYGWPKDAVEATIATLLVSGHLSARLNGQPVALKDLDQRKFSQADYRVQHPVLTAQQKMRIRKLYQTASHPFTAGSEENAAPLFIVLLKNLIKSAGGEQPCPVSPTSPLLTSIEALTQNDLLFALFTNADELEKAYIEWRGIADKIQERLPQYELTQKLLQQAVHAEIPKIDSARDGLEGIHRDRFLLKDPDLVAPIRQSLSALLREALKNGHAAYEAKIEVEVGAIANDPAWQKLSKEKQKEILHRYGVYSLPAPQVGSEQEVLSSLEQRGIQGWKELTDAIPARVRKALDSAIMAAKPKAQRVALPGATIEDSAQLDTWLNNTKSTIEGKLKDGPVILGG